MLKIIDRGLGILLLIGAGAHTFGAIKLYGSNLNELWLALCVTLLIVLLGTLNLVRSRRGYDHVFARITVAATASWLGATVALGAITGNFLDPRVIVNIVVCTGLIIIGLRSALSHEGAAGGPAAKPSGA
jgi:hypothetical protein